MCPQPGFTTDHRLSEPFMNDAFDIQAPNDDMFDDADETPSTKSRRRIEELETENKILKDKLARMADLATNRVSTARGDAALTDDDDADGNVLA